MHYIESEVTKASYLYRLSGSMRIQMMPMESGLCLSPIMAALVVSLVTSVTTKASIGDDKHKPDSIGITWISMLPDNQYK